MEARLSNEVQNAGSAPELRANNLPSRSGIGALLLLAALVPVAFGADTPATNTPENFDPSLNQPNPVTMELPPAASQINDSTILSVELENGKQYCLFP